MKTLHLGPEEVLVAAKIAVGAASTGASEVADTINAAEVNIRTAEPMVTALYLEPDIYDPNHVPDARPERPGRPQPLIRQIAFGRSGQPGASSPRLHLMDFRVADLTLADFGRKEISLAEHEMPGLMAMRAQYGETQAARRGQDRGLAAHDGADRGADRDPGGPRRRRALGELQHLLHPGPRGRGGRRRAGRDPDDPKGVPVFAWKGETLEEYWECTEQILTWPDDELANMILDDGGDATMLVHKGVEYEKAGEVPEPTEEDTEEWQVFLNLVRQSHWPRVAPGSRSPTRSRA